MKKRFLVIGMFFLLIISFLNSLSFGEDSHISENNKLLSDLDYFNKLCIFNHFNKYDPSQITSEDRDFYKIFSLFKTDNNLIMSEQESFNKDGLNPNTLSESSSGHSGLMNSAWPMYCHDIRHTGRSPYSTIDTWDEIWRFKQHKNDYVRGSPIVGDGGTIYFGGMDFYALYPNGTMKWKYDLWLYVESAPAIDEDGNIYIGTVYGDDDYLWPCILMER